MGFMLIKQSRLSQTGNGSRFSEMGAFQGKTRIFRGNLNIIWGRANNLGKVALLSGNRNCSIKLDIIGGNLNYLIKV